jgi:hypothetical protein
MFSLAWQPCRAAGTGMLSGDPVKKNQKEVLSNTCYRTCFNKKQA